MLVNTDTEAWRTPNHPNKKVDGDFPKPGGKGGKGHGKKDNKGKSPEKSGTDPKGNPDKSKEPCRFQKEGRCKFGNDCTRSHKGIPDNSGEVAGKPPAKPEGKVEANANAKAKAKAAAAAVEAVVPDTECKQDPDHVRPGACAVPACASVPLRISPNLGWVPPEPEALPGCKVITHHKLAGTGCGHD